MDLGGSADSLNSVQLKWDLKIPLRDGINLSATLYMPVNHAGTSPVIFSLTPYVAQVSHDAAVYFSARGYPFLTVDVRGRGNSEGAFKANGNEANDGYDIVEWIARQPYCCGKVAMWGGSYSGYVQWAAAKELPPHLATIVPVASPYRGVDSPAPKNIFLPYRIQWLTLLGGRTSQEKIFLDQSFWNSQFKRWFESGRPFREIDKIIGVPSDIFQEWLLHPHQDSYWDSYNPTAEQYERISIPILTITGIYDANQLGALMHYREHIKNASEEARMDHYLVIGPWDHAGTRIPKAEFGGISVGPASLIDLPALHLHWYAWKMQNGPQPDFLKRKVTYYVMCVDEWRYADSLEEITAKCVPYYLQSRENPSDVFRSGWLRTEIPRDGGGPDYYEYDPADVGFAEFESTVDPVSLADQRMIYAFTDRHLVYHSEPLSRETDVCGFFKLSVWLSIDQPDTDFKAAIYEISVYGSSTLLTTDLLRARYRESIRVPKLITKGKILRYDFERFTFVSRRMAKGSRLRLVIGPVNSIHSQKNYNSGGVIAEESMLDARTVTVKLFHDDERPSALYVPYGNSENGN